MEGNEDIDMLDLKCRLGKDAERAVEIEPSYKMKSSASVFRWHFKLKLEVEVTGRSTKETDKEHPPNRW